MSVKIQINDNYSNINNEYLIKDNSNNNLNRE